MRAPSRDWLAVRQALTCLAMFFVSSCRGSHAPNQIVSAAPSRTELAIGDPSPSSSAAVNGHLAAAPSSKITAQAFVADSCVRDDGGAVWCWHGGPGAAPSMPSRIAEFEDATAIVTAPVFTYILKTDGSVWTYGIAKDPGGAALVRDKRIYKDASVPERFEPLSNILAISANVFGLALSTNGDLFSWAEAYERNAENECTGYKRTVPKRVTSLPKAKGLADWYVIEQSGRLFFVGFEPDQKTLRPIWIPEITGVIQVALCSGSIIDACALIETGAVECWQRPGGTGKIKIAAPVSGLPAAKRIACSDDELYAIDRVGDLYTWNFAKSTEGTAAVHAQNLHAVADIQPHLGTIARPHCLIDQSATVACWATEHKLGEGDWVSWAGGSESRSFDAVTESLLKGVELTKMHPAP